MPKTIRAADLFCGAGGSSTGLIQAVEALGARLDLTAVNHWDVAVETHSRNHPAARHLCKSIDSVDPRKATGGRLDILIASPECTHHSIARGGKPMSDQSRASAWEVVRWAEAVRPRSIIVENVREFQTWGPLGSNGRPLKRRRGETFAAWVRALESIGYAVSYRVLNAADYGAATTRERLFVLARLGRRPVRWPDPTHTRGGAETLFGPTPRWRPAREVIDWTIPGQSIFNRKRPLKPTTLERIWAGLRKFGGAAFAMHTTHQGGPRLVGCDQPLPTVTGANRGELALCEPFIVPFFGERDGQAPRTHGVEAPLPTVTGQGAGGLVQPFVVQFKGTGPDQIPSTARSLEEPLGTITASGGSFGLCEPFLLGQQSGATPRPVSEPVPTIATAGAIALIEPLLMQMSQSGSNGDRLRSVAEPVPTITTADDLALVESFIVKYNRTATGAYSVDEPLDTISTRDRFALVTVHGRPALLDVRFRMLQPHELAAAMSFPPDYWFAGNRGEVVKQIGNAVDVRNARALCAAQLAG